MALDPPSRRGVIEIQRYHEFGFSIPSRIFGIFKWDHRWPVECRIELCCHAWASEVSLMVVKCDGMYCAVQVFC